MEPTKAAAPPDDEVPLETEARPHGGTRDERREPVGVHRHRHHDDPILPGAEARDVGGHLVRDTRHDVARTQLRPLTDPLQQRAPSGSPNAPCRRLRHLARVDEGDEWATSAAGQGAPRVSEQLVLLPYELELRSAPLGPLADIAEAPGLPCAARVLEAGTDHERHVAHYPPPGRRRRTPRQPERLLRSRHEVRHGHPRVTEAGSRRRRPSRNRDPDRGRVGPLRALPGHHEHGPARPSRTPGRLA